MKTLFVPALLALATSAAQALPSVKTLAQFDLGYARCESRFEHMKGRGDDAYLALYKIAPDAKQRAALARQRKTALYRDERAKAQKAMAKPSPELDEKVGLQCEATWSELQRNTKPARASAAPAAKPGASASKK